ncbi:MAG: homoserine kinase [Selenomonadaceae bacterium]|nr:homoserine kinase [Selenomonadaceae bacterium]
MPDRSIRVRVPGTSANLGAGFDTLGLACNLYNELVLTLTERPGVTFSVEGEGAGRIPEDDRNIVWRSIRLLLERSHHDKEYQGAIIRMKNDVPLSRGLGSSAAAIVAGLKAANVIVGNRYNRRELLQLATEIEGHPDNVAPAIFGGITVSTMKGRHVESFSFLPKIRLRFVVAVPDFFLSTKKARDVLPEMVPRTDAIFNIGRASMLVAALMKGSSYFLRRSFDDALHQPYRAELIPGMYDVFHAARLAGALGTVLSGAGPCLISFVEAYDNCEEAVGNAMREAFAQHGVQAEIKYLGLDTRGAHIINERRDSRD